MVFLSRHCWNLIRRKAVAVGAGMGCQVERQIFFMCSDYYKDLLGREMVGRWVGKI